VSERYGVVNGYLVEYVDRHTCGTSEGGYYGLHEPGCGMEPLGKVEDLLDRLAELERSAIAPAAPDEEQPDGELCGLCEDCRGDDGYYETPCGKVHDCRFCELNRGL
jgi:hypothetical protein